MTNLVTTYFVHLDEKFQLKQAEGVQDSDHDSVLEENEVREYEKRYREERQNNTTPWVNDPQSVSSIPPVQIEFCTCEFYVCFDTSFIF